MRRALLSLVVIAGCHAPEPARQKDVSIIGAPGDARAVQVASPEMAVADAGTTPPLRIEELTLTISDAPSDAKPLPAGKLLALPGEYVDRLEDPPRWLVRTGSGKKVSVVDRNTGKTLGAIDNAYADDLQRKHARLPGWRSSDKASGLLMLADGRVRIPRARLPDGKAVTVERLMTDDALDDVIVLGRDAQKKRRLGIWKLAAGDDVTLDRDAPVAAQTAQFDPVTKSFVIFVSTSTIDDTPSSPDDCLAAFFDEKRSECFRTGHDGASHDMTLLHGGFVAMPGALVDTQGHRELRSALGDRPILASALDSPPRALFVVNDGKFDPRKKTMRRKLELLSPEGTFGTFHLDIQTDFENSFHSARGQTSEPILAERGISQVANDVATDVSAVFVDLERGRVIRLPIAVSTLTRGTLPRRFLAVERGKPNDKLLFVDLDATKAVRLGTMPACPGPYWPSVEKNGVLALVCTKQPKPDLFAFVHLWSEIVQTGTMKRWHVDGDVVDVWPNGEVVRSAPGAILGEGSFPARGGVRVAKLE